MQGKVSIVVPCYNKEPYIGAMLLSVIAQKWDRVELILVNDGSTDGTREIIERFSPRIYERGYELKVIDQENRGLAGAVKEGLRHVSGEYCCSMDSDDEILPEYVSTMAVFLDDNPEYQWAACDLGVCMDRQSGTMTSDRSYFPTDPRSGQFTENFISMRFNTHIAHYLVRTGYMCACKIPERFYVTREGNQEPQFILPLAEGGGRLRYFPIALYKNNRYAAEHSKTSTPEEVQRYAKVFGEVYHKTVDTLDVSDPRREYLHGLCDLFELKLLVRDLLTLGAREAIAEVVEQALTLVGRQISPPIGLTAERILQATFPVFFTAFENVALNRCNLFSGKNPTPRRIIGYGALGGTARDLLPAFVGTSLWPDVLWDQGGPGVAITGNAVNQPEWDALEEGDLALFFPRHPDVAAKVVPRLEKKGVQVLCYHDMLEYLAAQYFGELQEKSRYLPGREPQ